MSDSPTVTLRGATMNIKSDYDVDLYDLVDRLDTMRDDMDYNSGDFETITQALAAIKHMRSESMSADRLSDRLDEMAEGIVDAVIFGRTGTGRTFREAPREGASLGDILEAALRDPVHRQEPISTGNNYGKITMIKAMREFMAEAGFTVVYNPDGRGYIGLKEAKDITEHMIAANELWVREQKAQGRL